MLGLYLRAILKYTIYMVTTFFSQVFIRFDVVLGYNYGNKVFLITMATMKNRENLFHSFH